MLLGVTTASHLLGDSKAELLVAKVELGVVGTQEHVAHDPEGTIGGRDVEADEAADARFLGTHALLHERHTHARTHTRHAHTNATRTGS